MNSNRRIYVVLAASALLLLGVLTATYAAGYCGSCPCAQPLGGCLPGCPNASCPCSPDCSCGTFDCGNPPTCLGPLPCNCPHNGGDCPCPTKCGDLLEDPCGGAVEKECACGGDGCSHQDNCAKKVVCKGGDYKPCGVLMDCECGGPDCKCGKHCQSATDAAVKKPCGGTETKHCECGGGGCPKSGTCADKTMCKSAHYQPCGRNEQCTCGSGMCRSLCKVHCKQAQSDNDKKPCGGTQNETCNCGASGCSDTACPPLSGACSRDHSHQPCSITVPCLCGGGVTCGCGRHCPNGGSSHPCSGLADCGCGAGTDCHCPKRCASGRNPCLTACHVCSTPNCHCGGTSCKCSPSCPPTTCQSCDCGKSNCSGCVQECKCGGGSCGCGSYDTCKGQKQACTSQCGKRTDCQCPAPCPCNPCKCGKAPGCSCATCACNPCTAGCSCGGSSCSCSVTCGQSNPCTSACNQCGCGCGRNSCKDCTVSCDCGGGRSCACGTYDKCKRSGRPCTTTCTGCPCGCGREGCTDCLKSCTCDLSNCKCPNYDPCKGQYQDCATYCDGGKCTDCDCNMDNCSGCFHWCNCDGDACVCDGYDTCNNETQSCPTGGCGGCACGCSLGSDCTNCYHDTCDCGGAACVCPGYDDCGYPQACGGDPCDECTCGCGQSLADCSDCVLDCKTDGCGGGDACQCGSFIPPPCGTDTQPCGDDGFCDICDCGACENSYEDCNTTICQAITCKDDATNGCGAGDSCDCGTFCNQNTPPCNGTKDCKHGEGGCKGDNCSCAQKFCENNVKPPCKGSDSCAKEGCKFGQSCTCPGSFCTAAASSTLPCDPAGVKCNCPAASNQQSNCDCDNNSDGGFCSKSSMPPCGAPATCREADCKLPNCKCAKQYCRHGEPPEYPQCRYSCASSGCRGSACNCSDYCWNNVPCPVQCTSGNGGGRGCWHQGGCQCLIVGCNCGGGQDALVECACQDVAKKIWPDPTDPENHPALWDYDPRCVITDQYGNTIRSCGKVCKNAATMPCGYSAAFTSPADIKGITKCQTDGCKWIDPDCCGEGATSCDEAGCRHNSYGSEDCTCCNCRLECVCYATCANGDGVCLCFAGDCGDTACGYDSSLSDFPPCFPDLKPFLLLNCSNAQRGTGQTNTLGPNGLRYTCECWDCNFATCWCEAPGDCGYPDCQCKCSAYYPDDPNCFCQRSGDCGRAGCH